MSASLIEGNGGLYMAVKDRTDEDRTATGDLDSGNDAKDTERVVSFLLRSGERYPTYLWPACMFAVVLVVFFAMDGEQIIFLAAILMLFLIPTVLNKNSKRRLFSVATFGQFSFLHLWRGRIWLSVGMNGTWRKDSRLLLNAWSEAGRTAQSSLRIILATAFFSERSLQKLGFETRLAGTFETIAFVSIYSVLRTVWVIVCCFRGRPWPPTPNGRWIVATQEIGRGAELTRGMVRLAQRLR